MNQVTMMDASAVLRPVAVCAAAIPALRTAYSTWRLQSLVSCAPCKEVTISLSRLIDSDPIRADTHHIYERACYDVVASYDCTLPKNVLLQCGPMETAEMAELICRKCNIPVLWEQFLWQLNAHTCELVANPPLIEGVERLVRHLAKYCVGLALITSSPRSAYEKKIRGREEFFNLFEHVLCSDEYNRHKPEPDCYLIAMSMFCDKPSPDCCLAFDGTPKGVQAARDARLQVIMLAEPDLPCCWSELATKRLETLEAFDTIEFGLPYLEPSEPLTVEEKNELRKLRVVQPPPPIENFPMRSEEVIESKPPGKKAKKKSITDDVYAPVDV